MPVDGPGRLDGLGTGGAREYVVSDLGRDFRHGSGLICQKKVPPRESNERDAGAKALGRRAPGALPWAAQVLTPDCSKPLGALRNREAKIARFCAPWRLKGRGVGAGATQRHRDSFGFMKGGGSTLLWNFRNSTIPKRRRVAALHKSKPDLVRHRRTARPFPVFLNPCRVAARRFR
jgi:hypothetical protein